MPHEFRNPSNLSHGELGLMLIGGLASAAVIIGLALLLAWKNRRKSAEGNQPRRPRPRKVKRRKRDIPREVAEDLVAHNMVSSTSSFWEALHSDDLRAEAEATAQILPVLMLHGSADLTAPLAGAQELAAARSTWEMRVLDGVDHHPWLRAPQECLQHIEQWLSRLSEQAPVSPAEPGDHAAGLGVRAHP